MELVPEKEIRAGIEEIKENTAHKGKDIFMIFEDDNLLLKPEYFFSVLALFREHLAIKGFFVETGIDYNLLHPGHLDTLLNLGLKRLNLSLGSIDREILKGEKRVLNIHRYEDILQILSNAGIPSTTYFICGFKHDTKESVARNLAYIAGKPTICGISLFYPVPGLPDFLDLSRFRPGLSNLCAGSSAYPWNNSLSTNTMITAFRLSRFSNVMKQGPSSSKEEELLEMIKGTGKLHTIIIEKKKQRIIKVPSLDQELVDMFFTLLRKLKIK
jgi:hypothetical protein